MFACYTDELVRVSGEDQQKIQVVVYQYYLTCQIHYCFIQNILGKKNSEEND